MTRTPVSVGPPEPRASTDLERLGSYIADELDAAVIACGRVTIEPALDELRGAPGGRRRVSALETRVDALAAAVGRLRRRGTGDYLVDEIAGHVETLDVILRTTAADLVARGVPVDEALAAVDARSAELRALLRGDRRRRRA